METTLLRSMAVMAGPSSTFRREDHRSKRSPLTVRAARGGVAALAALGALALALGASGALAPQPASGQSSAYVLVARSAFLYASPRTDAERARNPWAGRYDARLGPFWVLRVVGERDDWLEVATIPGFRAAEHCYGTVSALDGLDLRLFVRRADVAPVTASNVQRSFADGTAITLVGGVGLVQRGRGRYEAAVPGGTIPIALEQSEIARRYEPSPKSGSRDP